MTKAEALLAPFDFDAVIADKGYDSDPLRELLAAHQVEWSSPPAAIAGNHGTMTASATEDATSSNVSSTESSSVDAFSLAMTDSHVVSWLSCTLLLR